MHAKQHLQVLELQNKSIFTEILINKKPLRSTMPHHACMADTFLQRIEPSDPQRHHHKTNTSDKSNIDLAHGPPLPFAKVSACLEEGRLRGVQARVAQRHDHVVGRNQTHARRRAHLELVDLVPDLPRTGNLGSAQGQRHHAGMPALHPLRSSRTWCGQDTQSQLRVMACPYTGRASFQLSQPQNGLLLCMMQRTSKPLTDT